MFAVNPQYIQQQPPQEMYQNINGQLVPYQPQYGSYMTPQGQVYQQPYQQQAVQYVNGQPVQYNAIVQPQMYPNTHTPSPHPIGVSEIYFIF